MADTISFLVENQPGVLFKVSNLFRRRGFNIDSITVGAMEDPEQSRMTISVNVNSKALNQIVEQLGKMVEVIRIKRLDPLRTVKRELLLVKLQIKTPLTREEALRHINEHHGLILDIDSESVIAEITGDPEIIESFLEKVSKIGIEEFSRTGITALEKGSSKL